MIRTVSAVCIAAALGVGVTLGAQAPSAPDVKVTGCVDKDATGPLVLTGAVVEPAPGAPSGSVPDAIRAATTFRIEGSDLERHISEKVEVVGSATAPPAPPAPAPAAAAPAGAAAAAPTGAAARPAAGAAARPAGALAAAGRLNVKSLKSIHGYPCF